MVEYKIILTIKTGEQFDEITIQDHIKDVLESETEFEVIDIQATILKT